VASVYIHPTADVSPEAVLGEGVKIWNQAQVREGAHVGADCIIGKNVYVDFGVKIGARVKIQNNSSVFHGVTLEDGVFVGPHVCFCNDMLPRAISPDGSQKGQDDWEVGPTTVGYGASIGAGSIILPSVTIGKFAMVGAGSVVTRSVPAHALVFGNPAVLRGYVCACGRKLDGVTALDEGETPECPVCKG
jgi:acetyltransferase-like isoleucine patch superfamily enzyme